MSSLHSHWFAAFGSALCAVSAAWAAPDDAVTPYRPSVSSPAQLSAPGQLELELGGLRQRSGDARRDSVPYLFKLAFDTKWAVLLGGEAQVAARDASSTVRGGGDTTLTLKRAWSLDEESAAGLEAGVKLPTAPSSIGSGKADFGLNAIYSRELGAMHMDLNLNAMRLGAVQAGEARPQTGLSAALSTSLGAHWTLAGELSGTHQGGVGSTTQWLTALSFSPNKRLALDFGVARAFRPSPGTRSVFAGVVFPVAQLW